VTAIHTPTHTHTPGKSCKVWLTLKGLSMNKAVPETRVVRCQDRTIDGLDCCWSVYELFAPADGYTVARRTYHNACIPMERLADFCSWELVWGTRVYSYTVPFFGRNITCVSLLLSSASPCYSLYNNNNNNNNNNSSLLSVFSHNNHRAITDRAQEANFSGKQQIKTH